MVTVPAAVVVTAETRPESLTVTITGFDELQAMDNVRSHREESAYVAVATNCRLDPGVNPVTAGSAVVTAMDVKGVSVTVSVVDPEIFERRSSAVI